MTDLERAGAASFYATFGAQYPRESHPRWPFAHHDGWVHIDVPKSAKAYEQARHVAHAMFDRHWSNLYDADDFEPELFPRGELAVISCPSSIEWSRFDVDQSRAVAMAQAADAAARAVP